MLVRRILLVEGYTVDEASNAPDGINMALQRTPDLILMDISMPGVDGITATKQIRTMPEIAHVPVVALTALAMTGDKEKILQAGCDGYISKPINIDTFVDEVQSFLK
jgi:two-component system cell cycle response regulator DivK